MAKTIKIDLETGACDVPVPPESASVDEKDEKTLALTGEIGAELDELEEQAEADARAALVQAWVLNEWLEAYPKSWIKDFAKRRERNGLATRLKELKQRCEEALGEPGKSVWPDLDFLKKGLPLLFEKQRASGEVMRLILSPLGKLENHEILYQRTAADDLQRVCQDLQQIIRQTEPLDAKALSWGEANFAALLKGDPPAVIPASLKPPMGAAFGLLGGGALALAGGVAVLAGVAPGVPAAAGIGAAVVGAVLGAVGALKFKGAAATKAALPGRFADLSSKYRERLYIMCTLRVLYRKSSRYTVCADAFDQAVKEYGGKQQWKRLKFEGRDLTEVFATETWDQRGSVEHWVSEKVKERYRLDSTTLTAPEKIDEEAWDVIHKAYLLESGDYGDEHADGKLLGAVSDLLFVRRGENTKDERVRVFAQVQKAWENAVKG